MVRGAWRLHFPNLCIGDVLPGATSWRVLPLDAGRVVVRGFSGDSACREESASAGIRFGAGGLRPGLCGLLVRP